MIKTWKLSLIVLIPIIFVCCFIFIFGGIYVFEEQISNFDFNVSDMTSFPSEEILLYKVVDVVDGDTIKVEINGEKETVRLIGVDTPETVHPSKPVECFGREASNKTKSLVQNQLVRLAVDSTQDDTDKYGRLLRYVYTEDGKLVNLELIKEGYAYEYTYQVPYQFQIEFKLAQNNAELNNTGLWGAGCVK